MSVSPALASVRAQLYTSMLTLRTSSLRRCAVSLLESLVTLVIEVLQLVILLVLMLLFIILHMLDAAVYRLLREHQEFRLRAELTELIS